MRPSSNDPQKRQRQEFAPQESLQVSLQFVDDSWERLLNALERLEQVTENYHTLSATRLDNHPDRNKIRENEVEIRSEVDLQVMVMLRVLHPVRKDSLWLIKDFLSWYGVRDKRTLAPVDEYAVPILQCILNQPFQLPKIPHVPPTQQDILQATEAYGVGTEKTQKIVDEFQDNPNKSATRHMHARGSVKVGLDRLRTLRNPWVDSFITYVKQQRLLD